MVGRPKGKRGASVTQYAKHAGVSYQAVANWRGAGKLVCFPDGSIDVAESDALRRGTMDPGKPGAIVDAAPEDSYTFLEARTANEVVKLERAKLALAQEQGELVDREQTMREVYKMAREVREAWVNWPTRAAPSIASALGADVHATFQALAAAVRDHLEELAEVSGDGKAR